MNNKQNKFKGDSECFSATSSTVLSKESKTDKIQRATVEIEKGKTKREKRIVKKRTGNNYLSDKK